MSLFNKIMGINDYDKILDDTLNKSEKLQIEEDLLIEEESQNLEQPLAIICFILNPNGDVDISTEWNEQPEFAKMIAKLLYAIHSGETKMDHLKFFDDYLEGNQSSLPFLKKVVHEWAKLEKDDKPLIKPHNVFKIPFNGSAGSIE